MLRSGVLLFFGLLTFIRGWICAVESVASSELADERVKKDHAFSLSRQKSIKKMGKDACIAAVAYIDSQTYKFVESVECPSPELPTVATQQIVECAAFETESSGELPNVIVSHEKEEAFDTIQSESQPVGRQRSITVGSDVPKPKTLNIPLLKIHGGRSSNNLLDNSHSNILAHNPHEPAVRAIAKASRDSSVEGTWLCPFHRRVKGDTPLPNKKMEMESTSSPLGCLRDNDTSPDADSLSIKFESKRLMNQESHAIDETLEAVEFVAPVISSSSSEEEIVKKIALVQLAAQNQESKAVAYEESVSPDSPEGYGPIVRLAIAKQMFGQQKCETDS